MTVTEVCIFPVKEGTFTSGGAGKADYDKALGILTAAAECQRVLQGESVDKADTVVWLVDWEELQSHRNFQKTDAYGPLRQLLWPHFMGPPDVFHISYPERNQPIATPPSGYVTALSTVIAKPDKVDEAKSSVNELHTKNQAAKSTSTSGAEGATYGIGIEDSNKILMITGWKNGDEHAQYSKSSPNVQEFAKKADSFIASQSLFHAALTPA